MPGAIIVYLLAGLILRVDSHRPDTESHTKYVKYGCGFDLLRIGVYT